MSGIAFGQAKIEICKTAPEGAPAPCDCERIEGGSLSVGLLSAATAAMLAYFGLPF